MPIRLPSDPKGSAFYLKGYYDGILDSEAKQPSAEKTGKWIFSPDHAEGVCTRCNYKIYGRPYQNTYVIVPYNYCPNCGARMEGE